MIIEQIFIDSFGTLQQRTFTFTPGLNVIEGENEAGKSTLCLFIKFMLYGFSPRTDEKQHGVSFVTGRAAGNMTILLDDKRYRIERELRANHKETVRVLDLNTGAPAFVGEEPGVAIFGVNSDVFTKTALIGQLDGNFVGGKPLKAAVENILFSASEDINAKKAIQKLDEVRAFYLHKNQKGGRLYELELLHGKLEKELESAVKNRQSLAEIQKSMEDARRNREKNREKIERFSTIVQMNEELRSLQRVDQINEEQALQKQELQEVQRILQATYHTDQMPKEDRASALRVAAAQLRHAQNMLTEEQQRCREIEFCAKQENPKEDLMRQLEQTGGLEEVRTEKNRCLHGQRACGICGVLFLLFALASGGFLGWRYFQHSEMDNIHAIVTAVLFALCLCFFLIRRNLGEKLGTLLKKYRCDTVDEFENFLEEYSISEVRLNLHADNLNAARLRESQAQEAVEKEENACAALLQDLQPPNIPPIDPSNLKPEYLEDIADQLQYAVEEIRAHQSRAEQHGAIAQSILDQLHEYGSVEAVRQRIAYLHAQIAENNPEGLNSEQLKMQMDFARKANASLEERLSLLYQQQAKLGGGEADPETLKNQLSMSRQEYQTAKQRYDATVLALQALEKASEELRGAVAPRLCAHAGHLVEQVTQGKYSEFYLDENYQMIYHDGTATRAVDYLSAGTQDLTYFSLRLGLIEELFRRTQPPLILDESFSKQDNQRLQRLISALSHHLREQHGQALLFTCHDRESTAALAVHDCNLLHL